MSNETEPIRNTDDVIDSRDVIARIEYLKASWAESTGDNPDDFALSADDWRIALSDDEADELVALQDLQRQAEPYCPDWTFGEALIRDSYFEDYARELADDLGTIDRDAPWPLTYIDWERAAEALQMDYTSVEFDGETYWVR